MLQESLLENLEGGLFTGDFVRWMKGDLEMRHLSLKRPSTEDLAGGLLYWGPWKALGMGISLHGGSVGECGGGVSLYVRSVKGTWREGFLSGDP
jgi:hypothetical protein